MVSILELSISDFAGISWISNKVGKVVTSLLNRQLRHEKMSHELHAKAEVSPPSTCW